MQRRSCRTGFTLAELVAAMAVMSILVLALSSALVIATRALPNPDRPVNRMLNSSSAFQQLADELAEAVEITERGAHTVAFLVSDRDGDGAPEHIRYAWAETADAPLTRSHNRAEPAVVVDGVHDFALEYTLRSESETYPGAVFESSEFLLTSRLNTVNDEYDVKEKEWVAQAVKPNLPAEALSWRLTRFKFSAASKGPKKGVTAVQVRLPAANGLPGTTVLDTQLMAESALSESYSWQEFSFSNAGGIAPETSIYVALVNYVKDADLCRVEYDDKSPTTRMAQTNDKESKWEIKAEQDMKHSAYGTYAYEGPPQTAERRYLTSVQMRLQAGAESTSLMHTAARTPNEPEVLGGFWEIHADEDPAVDRNGDGAADFTTSLPLATNPDLLLDGGTAAPVPVSGQVLSTQPDCAFNDLQTVRVRFRDANASDGQPAMICVNTDWSGSASGQLHAGLTLQPDGTQTLLVSAETAAGGAAALVSESGLPADLVELRLLIDPSLHTVNVQVNKADRGTFTYATRYRLAPTQYLQVAPWNSNLAEFARVTIRVGDRAP